MNFQDIIREVYDGDNKVLKTSATVNANSTVFIGTPTLYAVVNTGAAGDPKTYIGLVTATLDNSRGVSLNGNVTLSDAKTYIGLTTSTIGNTPTVFLGTPTLYAVVNTGAAGDPKTYIGLVTATLDNSRGIGVIGNLTLSDSKTYIGLTTTTLGISDRFIGLTTSVNSQAWPDPKTYIGLNTVTNGAGDRFMGLVTAWVSGVAGNMTLSDAKTYVGLTTTTLGVGTQFIGLVTALTRNAGSAKTLTPYAVTLSTGSVATIAVPTNNQSMFITTAVLSSDATVRLSIKSGVTYITGNASIGITLNPGGGFPLMGSPDSPAWIGLPSGALVIEKFDMTGTKANVGGFINTFTE